MFTLSLLSASTWTRRDVIMKTRMCRCSQGDEDVKEGLEGRWEREEYWKQNRSRM